jgi:hypothetical protein
MALTNLDIDQLLRADPMVARRYLGTFAIDQLTDTVLPPGRQCLVVNTAPSDVRVGHWIALVCNRTQCDVFCPFGLSYGAMLSPFLNKNGIEVVRYNRFRVQAYDSLYCGYFVVLYLRYRMRGMSLRKFLQLFSTTTEINDTIVRALCSRTIDRVR